MTRLNFHFITRCLLGLVTITFFIVPAWAESDWDEEIVTVIRKARPGVVNVEAKTPITHRLGPIGKALSNRVQEEKGSFRWYISVASGIVWTENTIVTIATVVRDAQSFTVTTFDNHKYEASLLGVDEETNLAVLKVNATSDTLKSLPQRTAPLQEGSWLGLLAFGFGGVPTLSTGIAGIPPEEFDPSRNWFQFTAPLRPGNSGGALIDSNGNLAGIVLGREEDIGFNAVLKLLTQHSTESSSNTPSAFSNFGIAIPISKAGSIVKQLLENGRVLRGWIGVAVRKFEYSDTNRSNALEIVNIIAESPAEHAGLHVGDILLKYDDKIIQDPSELGLLVANSKPGEDVIITYDRAGVIATSCLVPQSRPAQSESQGTSPESPDSQKVIVFNGLQFKDLSPSLLDYFRIPEQTGVLVSGVRITGETKNIDVQIGDIITHLDKEPVISAQAMVEKFNVIRRQGRVVLSLYRNGERINTILPLLPK